MVGWCGGLAGSCCLRRIWRLRVTRRLYIGPNPYNSENKVVVFYAGSGRAVSDFIYRYWQFAKDAVTFDAYRAAIVDPAVVR